MIAVRLTERNEWIGTDEAELAVQKSAKPHLHSWYSFNSNNNLIKVWFLIDVPAHIDAKYNLKGELQIHTFIS